MEKLSPLNFDIKCGDNTGKTYPYEIAYNAALVGKFLFCYKKYTEKLILEQAEKKGITVIDIKQGYAKCSVAYVSENALITGDKQIYRAALDNGLDNLLVTNEGVMLDGYKNGFIGGASVKIGNKLCFTGDISVHRDYEKIKEFCIDHHTELIFEKDIPLYDYGSPLYLENSII
jgi:hypothetical protein